MTSHELRDILVRRGLETQRERAQFCGVWVRTVRRWERDNREVPPPIARLGFFLGLIQLPRYDSPRDLVNFHPTYSLYDDDPGDW